MGTQRLVDDTHDPFSLSLGVPGQPNHSFDPVPVPEVLSLSPATRKGPPAEGCCRGIGLQHCAVTDDGVRSALECDCVRWSRHDLPSQAGIGVYERGPDGLLATARVYDDVKRPIEHRSRPIERSETLAAAGRRSGT